MGVCVCEFTDGYGRTANRRVRAHEQTVSVSGDTK